MYQALYRKYRPLVFSDVAGQTHVTDTLRAQVSAGRLSHAYLFTGTRGTGKTTCAKILARASICLSPSGGNPCNRCAPCTGALDGSLLDVMEIDAASNSGVDNIRSLREEAAYTPVSARRRVYIIDEVHMLSSGAFNALLKTLEEPPDYVLFILATTETHKVPATILSRCQRFAFKRLDERDISERLLYVAQKESISLAPAAASLLARLSDGALRDALSLLDQCAASVQGDIGEPEVYQALGLAGGDTIARLADSITRGEAGEALSLFHEQVREGRDVTSLLGELSQTIRDALMASIQDEKTGALTGTAARKQLELLSALRDGMARLPRAAQPRIEAELCLLRMCCIAGGIERVGVTAAVPASRVTVPEKRVQDKQTDAPERAVKPVETPAVARTESEVSGQEVKSAPPEQPVPLVKPKETADGAESDWESIRREAAALLPRSVSTFLMLDGVTPSRTEGMWRIVVPDELTYSRLSGKNVIEALTKAASERQGSPVSVRVVRRDPGERQASPQLRMLLDQFDGGAE